MVVYTEGRRSGDVYLLVSKGYSYEYRKRDGMLILCLARAFLNVCLVHVRDGHANHSRAATAAEE